MGKNQERKSRKMAGEITKRESRSRPNENASRGNALCRFCQCGKQEWNGEMTMGFGSMKVTGDRDKGNIGGVMETNA